jgi:hypothetical protein
LTTKNVPGFLGKSGGKTSIPLQGIPMSIELNTTDQRYKAFEELPVEEDTTILARLTTNFDDYPVIYEKWFWDGITAESIIFLTEDIQHLDDEALEKYVRESPLVREDSKMTIKRLERYTFVNFNFDY